MLISNRSICHSVILSSDIYREGDITSLSVSAITHPTNESFTDHSLISQKILDCAGPKLKEELVTKIKCKFYKSPFF